MSPLDAFFPFSSVLLKNKQGKIALLVANILSLVAGFVRLSYLAFYGTEQELDKFINSEGIIFLIIPSLTIFLLLLYALDGTQSLLETQLDKIRKDREIITEKLEKEPSKDIFYTIQLSLNQLNEYYTINKGQAKSSFGFSIVAIVAGLTTILTGIWLYYFKNHQIQITYITGISGIILEFIGGAYFFIYKKSLEQVNFFFGQLIKVQDTMLAIDLAKQNSNTEKRSLIEEKIILSLLERSLK